MSPAAFLLARIAEDEREARSAIVERDRIKFVDPPEVPDMELIAYGDAAVPAVLVGPERVLAECEAKRALVAAFEAVNTSRGNDAMSRIEPLVRRFAAAHSEHPDYNPAWSRR